MSIIAVADVGFRPENGWDSPNYPIRIWQASWSVTGDASGGVMTAQLNMKSAQTQPGNAFSLEQLGVVQSETAAGNPDLGLDGFELLAPGNVIQHWFLPTVAVDVISDNLLEVSKRTSRFLGRTGAQAAAATISISLGNANTETLECFAMGYMWTSRSVTQGQGGYKRPPDGLFGV